MQFEMALSGEALDLVARFSRTRSEFRRNARRATEALASECASRVRVVLETQAFAAVPLTPKYLARKRRRGLDERVMIATREYLDSIQARGSTVVGDEKKMLLGEFGTVNQPPRPHWDLVMLSMTKDSGALVAEAVLKPLVG